MSTLHLSVLGSPQVLHGASQPSFSTRKELALLVYLAVEGGIHTRKHLTQLLWPESDATRGRAAFRITLSRLRDALNETSASGEPVHLVVERNTLKLDMTDVTLDLHTVQKAWTLAHQTSCSSTMLPEETRQSMLTCLHQASVLWRSRFLDDFLLRDTPSFEDWTRFQQEFWQQRMRLILDRLSWLQEEGGEVGPAMSTLTLWRELDPLNEEVYRRLMRLFIASGNRTQALQTYETLRGVLAHDLQLEPAPETRALVHAFQTAPLPSRYEQQRDSSALDERFAIPLVGRQREFHTLIESYRTAQHGQTRVALLEGEAGIGKTRLAQEFVDWAREQGADVLQGRAFEMGGRLPYQLLIAALRPRLDAENAPDDLLADVWLAELTRILPEIRDRYPDLPTPTTDEAIGRTQLFEAVVRLVQAWTKRKPVVLFLDDLHWADSASLDLLLYLVGRWQESSTPVLVLLSLRSEALASTPSLSEWNTHLAHDTLLTHLVLTPLSASETLTLIESLSAGTEREMTQQVGQWLYRQTAGQPFYLLETLKLLLEQKAILPSHASNGWWSFDLSELFNSDLMRQGVLPRSVRDLLRVRLRPLSQDASSLLFAGAVLDGQSTLCHHCR